MEERYKSNVTVSLILFRNDKREILLQKRKNTGYMDGMYDTACSGHLEKNESVFEALIREAKEEIGIIINKNDIKLISVIHAKNENYINFFFEVTSFDEIPVVMEKEKCEELRWFNINEIPEDIIPKLKQVLEMIDKGIICDEQ